MITQTVATRDNLVYYRLVALWVVCEGMLGGVIHGLRIPISGLVVGSCAVTCICLIAYYVPVRGAIIRATIIVAIFKMMLSPQAPFPAYIAVLFQGLLGAFIFHNRKSFRISCMLFAAIALTESGVQRILVLTIIYGNDLWTVTNDFIGSLVKEDLSLNYSKLIALAYVLLHLLIGLLVGIWAARLPSRVAKWVNEKNQIMTIKAVADWQGLPPAGGRNKWKTALFVIWAALLIIFILSYFDIGRSILPTHVSLRILLRSMLVVLSWYFIVAPLLTKALHSWLKKKQTQWGLEIQTITELLPATRYLIMRSWAMSGNTGGRKRIMACVKLILINSMHTVKDRPIYMLTAPVGSGKTSSLLKWAERREDVAGIFTPIVNGERVFMNIENGETFSMQSREPGEEKYVVGKYMFSKPGFDKAISYILAASAKEIDWLVIDEIGPLELQGQGFCNVLKDLLMKEDRGYAILLVVRDGMTAAVKEFFALDTAVVINDVSSLNE